MNILMPERTSTVDNSKMAMWLMLQRPPYSANVCGNCCKVRLFQVSVCSLICQRGTAQLDNYEKMLVHAMLATVARDIPTTT